MSDIYQEHVSEDNGYFVLHVSQGFEPGDLSNFRTVRTFLEERSRHSLPLKDRVHCLWCIYLFRVHAATSQTIIRLCVETPTAGGRLFETGDEELVKFAQKIQRAFFVSPHFTIALNPLAVRPHSVPTVIVFTQYDRLVRTKRAELKEDNPFMIDDTLNIRCVEEAWMVFQKIVQALERSMRRLSIQMPPYARVSGIFLPLLQIGILTTLQFVRTSRKKFQNSCKSLEVLSKSNYKAILG